MIPLYRLVPSKRVFADSVLRYWMRPIRAGMVSYLYHNRH